MKRLYGVYQKNDLSTNNENFSFIKTENDQYIYHAYSIDCYFDIDVNYYLQDNNLVCILGYISNINDILKEACLSSFPQYVIAQIKSNKIDIMANKFSGLFTLFVILEGKILIISDRYRSRSIYYNEDNQAVYFSNNILHYFYISKVRPEFDWNHSLRVNNYTGESNLCWKGIKELIPCEIVNIERNIIICNNWTILPIKKFYADSLDESISKAINRFDFNESVISLSGGVDSGLLAAYTKNKIHSAITINWDTMIKDGEYDRAKQISSINYLSLLDVSINYITINDYLNFLVYYSTHTMTTEYLMKINIFSKASLSGFKKVFTGQGVDELFGGYSYPYKSYKEYLHNKLEETIVSFLLKNGIPTAKSYIINYNNIDLLYPNSGLNNLREYDIISQTSSLGWTSLYTEEKCASLNGTVNYSPFLENDIYSFSLGVKNNKLLYNKKIVRDLYVAKYNSESPPKIPFVYGNNFDPVKKYLYDLLYLKTEGNDCLLDVIMDTKAFNGNGILNKDHFLDIIQAIKNDTEIPETIELIYKLANCALLDEYMGKVN